jgi:hypothetical protein
MKYPTTYLYTLYDNDSIFYVGKTKTPKERFRGHYNNTNKSFTMEIVGEYIDEEDKLILNLIKENKTISNLQIPKNSDGNFTVGTKFKSSDIGRRGKRIFDKNLNKMFNTWKECAEHYNITNGTIKNYFSGKITYSRIGLNLEQID